ncbi:hypothetical protein H4R35_007061 [Dimargaris xerosporica]|nr:hypothetical protein H4R35_007061 [Dimargaris xerosporica]
MAHLQATTSAALVSRLCTHPLDTIKTRIQVEYGTYRAGWVRAVGRIWHTEPWQTFYRGLPVALTFSVPALTTYLTTYEFIKEKLDQWAQNCAKHAKPDTAARPVGAAAGSWLQTNHIGNFTVAAIGAEMVSGLIWTPMEVLKTQLQAQSSAASPALLTSSATWQLARCIGRTEGFAGFLRGYWLSLAVFVPHTVVYFITYEKLKAAWARHDSLAAHFNATAASGLPFYAYLCSATLACILSAGISNVFDVVKTRWQAHQQQETKQRISTLVRYMWCSEGGPRAFTRGVAARVISMTPSVAISMTTYEVVKHHLLDNKSRARA